MSRLFAGTPFDKPRICDRCGKAPADCRCMQLPEKQKMSQKEGGGGKKGEVKLDSGLVLTPQNSKAPADQVARIQVEKRKGNRFVTIISGLDHPGNDLPALCGALKEKLGVGGSIQGRTIELQGDQAGKVDAELQLRKFKTRVV
jgi:translation initiation factor 1